MEKHDQMAKAVAEKVAAKIKVITTNSPTLLTSSDRASLAEASANGARPVTDDVCQYCGDFGYRKATDADLPFMKLDEFELKRFHAGDTFNVECEHCRDKRLAKHIKAWQDKSRLTDSEREITLDNIVVNSKSVGTAQVKKACEEMVTGDAFMLTIYGTSGNAKSIALIGTVNAFLEKWRTALYITLVDALDWIQAAYNENGTLKDDDTALARYQTLENVTLLALDEMQDAKESDWVFKILATLVNRRQRNAIDGKAFTIMATNKQPSKLPPQIYSRMKDGQNRKVGSPIIFNDDTDQRPNLRRKNK